MCGEMGPRIIGIPHEIKGEEGWGKLDLDQDSWYTGLGPEILRKAVQRRRAVEQLTS